MTETVNGIGLGLRYDLATEFLERRPKSVSWVEVHPENYVERGGRYAEILDLARRDWPVVTHGLSTCFGALEPADEGYLSDLRAFLNDLEVPWHSEHLCIGAANARFFHDLLPLPFTDEAVATSAQRICEMRDALDVPIALENVSYYAPEAADGLDEAEFVVEVLERADAKLLLDVNNVYVNARNFGFDPEAYIDKIPVGRVVQIHVAGHLVRDDGLRIDTHGEPVPDDVYRLLEYALRKVGPVPVLLERDNNVPALEELLVEIDQLWAIYERATGDQLAS
ncbi:MAG: DUF692 domain-containing protein [Myxococcales bacterium]|nr:DUF692 domain-containing protein [Myxococcales bacterium]MDH3484552.1 DUF692 domain-containing protein [Myxococcales bacterium]